MAALFHDPDTQDFCEAWQASLLGRETSIHDAYGAGWNAAVRHMSAIRKFEEEQYRRSCED